MVLLWNGRWALFSINYYLSYGRKPNSSPDYWNIEMNLDATDMSGQKNRFHAKITEPETQKMNSGLC